MTPDRAELKRRRAALKSQVKERRRALRSRLGGNRAEAASRRRRRRLALLAVLVLLLLFLRECSCDPGFGFGSDPTPTPTAVPTPSSTPTPSLTPTPTPTESNWSPPTKRKPKQAKAKKPKKKRPPLVGNIETRMRGEYRSEGAAPPPWMTAFRIQVAARSSRLSGCFERALGPGALRWTAQVDPLRGLVSDHTFEPVLGGPPVTVARRRCLEDILSKPAYRFAREQGRGPPERISIVLEF